MKHTKSKSPKTNTTPKVSSSKISSYSYFTWFGINIIALFVFGIIISQIIKKTPGYDWVYNTLLKGNMELIDQYKDLSLDQKWEMKIGYSYVYLNHIKENTPENAVILYPAYSLFVPEGQEARFATDISNKIWVSRFIHPRKIVLFDESGIEKSKYADSATYVAIVNMHGMEKIRYNPGFVLEQGVLPLDSINFKALNN